MSAEATVLYFAYGSNMLTRRIQARVPSARPVAAARLEGHRLCWHKRGGDGSAKCDIVATDRPADRVWGVVFRLALAEKPRLDRVEDLGRSYLEKRVRVTAAAGPLDAWAYYALAPEQGLLPYDWYKAFVVEGAREHGLPAAYLAGLEAVEALEDPDRDRRERNLALL